ncbi:hypothetical protein F2P81_016226 [Scophthalmus maximus]|uniref:Uncharacterized protein n=1 Tax=Scophthalmus maximus TaxID=52904 RepID=A0A6A4SKK6_SCOMX|nr:hypothetical protein F2P81_016226 [Scophthalmus maximus]
MLLRALALHGRRSGRYGASRGFKAPLLVFVFKALLRLFTPQHNTSVSAGESYQQISRCTRFTFTSFSVVTPN